MRGGGQGSPVGEGRGPKVEAGAGWVARMLRGEKACNGGKGCCERRRHSMMARLRFLL
jgi:hypothetical protein